MYNTIQSCNYNQKVKQTNAEVTRFKKVISDNGYSACERCVQHGKYINYRVLLLDNNCSKRTDRTFLDKVDIEHHKFNTNSILETLKYRMTTGFLLDVMHLFVLGITKRLIKR